MHTTISPAILYFGSIVLLITTENPDGTPNITPMSSAWFLGPRCMLGLASISQGTINILRTRQCVLNLPSENMGQVVNTLARTTGTEEIPPMKQSLGYRYVKDKFGVAGLTTQTAEMVSPIKIKECPVQMEAELVGIHEMGGEPFLALEVKILRTHVEDGQVWLDMRIV
ncbi:hypothetical protein MMC14_006694 [Varicellaria rhodocarpa]|nr:hypothetical protein [Varicellaria rhodocarpa]